MIDCVSIRRHVEVFQIRTAREARALFAKATDRRNEHCREDGDDHDHRDQLEQGERLTSAVKISSRNEPGVHSLARPCHDGAFELAAVIASETNVRHG